MIFGNNIDPWGNSKPKQDQFKPGDYVMTQAMSEQDKRTFVADIVAYSVMNKVPSELSNKLLVEKYIDQIRSKVPENVLTYISQYDYSRRQPILSGMFIYIDDPKGGPPIEYPAKYVEAFFSFWNSY